MVRAEHVKLLSTVGVLQGWFGGWGVGEVSGGETHKVALAAAAASVL